MDKQGLRGACGCCLPAGAAGGELRVTVFEKTMSATVLPARSVRDGDSAAWRPAGLQLLPTGNSLRKRVTQGEDANVRRAQLRATGIYFCPRQPVEGSPASAWLGFRNAVGQ